MFQAEHLQEKWSPVLEHPDLPKIGKERIDHDKNCQRTFTRRN